MTRAPWRVGITKDGGRLSCGCWVNTLMEHTCPLHTAAPDLLAALKRLLYLATGEGPVVSLKGLSPTEEAKAAIAKAEGKDA